jgi:hypothetical protein
MSYYKYLELRWARALVEEGSVMFSSLAWFQDSEDPSRGDEFEGVRKYFTATGLPITRVSEPAGSFVDPGHSFQSVARERDHIFIFSVSRRLSPELEEQFGGPGHEEMACVEIHDSARFYDRLVRVLGKRSPVQRRTCFHDDVTYYPFERPPEVAWALPATLATHKEESRFSREEEHRFVFSTKRHAFDANRVETFLVGNASVRRRHALDPARHRRLLALGPLGECCRIVPCR